MKKKKLPKYVDQLFSKPQFKIGDLVKYEFLGDSGWGIVKSINKYNDKITYMVQGHGYTYPCGIQIKEYSSYYAGSIDIETTKARSDSKSTRNDKVQKSNDIRTRKRVSGSSSNTVSDTRIGSRTANGIRTSNADNGTTNESSQKKINNDELDNVIIKQQEFLRRIT